MTEIDPRQQIRDAFTEQDPSLRVHITASRRITDDALADLADTYAEISGIPRADITTGRPRRRRWWHSYRREITRIRAESRRLLVRMYYDRLTRRNP